VLEDTEVMPLGATQAQPVATAIVAASNADFAERIAQGRFRQDLYFRLARFIVEAPPLRERRDDIPLLAHHFLHLFAREMNLPPPCISEPALQALADYDFPGNVRELKNVLERALMESEGTEVQVEHLHFFAGFRPACAASGQGNQTGADTDEARILAYVRAHGAITNGEGRGVLGSDRNHASYVLHKLTAEGVLICEGQGRWARYRWPC
jgi:DNA-binding NtrC family response regulator